MKLQDIKQQVGAFQFYLLLGLILGLACVAGYKWAEHDNVKLQREHIKLNQSINSLQDENNALNKQLNILGVELELAKLTQKQHFEELKLGKEREHALQTEVSFYQQVVAPELSPDGFVIDSFNIQPALSEGLFRYELVLMQQKKIKDLINGTIELVVVGSENNKAKRYELSKLSPSQEKNIKFGFKYFQLIEGQLLLPKGFIPERVEMLAKIYQFKRKRGELSKVFDWQFADSE